MTIDTAAAIGIRGIRILVLVYFCFGAYLFLIQRQLLYFPELGYEKSCAAFAEAGAKKIIHQETTLYYKENGKTLVVFYHGNAGTACDRSMIAQELDQNNVSYLFVEYAGYADDRKTTQEHIFQDVKNADDFLRTLHYGKLIFMSESLGAGPLAYHVTLRPADGIALISPYTRLSDVAQAHFPYSLYPAARLLRDDFDTAALSTFEGEALVIHGQADEIIPFELGKRVYETIPSREKEALFVPGATHNSVLDMPGVMTELLRFLRSEEGSGSRELI